jgi:glycosyltransferase involved in cell wall biosynthesis
MGVIVPYHGGAGMQSKVFEPLMLGVPIIANPKNFAGYNFEPFKHFYPATNTLEYLEGINYFVNNKNDRVQMGQRAREESMRMFTRERIQNVLIGLFSHGE